MKAFGEINQDLMRAIAPKAGRRELLPELSPEAQLALMCRMLFNEGWDDHIAGHISWRQPDGSLLTNPWELAWDEVCASDIVRLDADGKHVSGEWNVTPAIGLHLQLHKAREDAHVVLHNHPKWSGLWAAAGKVPSAHDQSSAYVDGPLPLVNEYKGTFDDRDLTAALVEELADAKWALLAHHGALVIAKDLRQCHLRAITLEWRSRRAWEVMQLGGGDALSDEQVEQVALPDANGFPFLIEAMARRELRRDPSVLD